MAKFSEYIKNDIPKVSSEREGEINDLVNKYSGYSEDELVNEFVRQTNFKRQNGEMDDAGLDRIKDTLSPYLNKEQQARLNEIMKMVK